MRRSDAIAGLRPVSGPVYDAAREIDLLVACIATRVQCRQAWIDAHGADYAEGGPDTQTLWEVESELGRHQAALVQAADDALARFPDGCLNDLTRLFDLDQDDRTILMTTLAVRLEPALSASYQRLTHRPWATEPLVQQLFGFGRKPIWDAAGALAVWGLVTEAEAAPGEPPPLVCDPILAFWLAGDARLDAAFDGQVEILDPPPPLDAWPIDATADAVRARWQDDQPVRLIVRGEAGGGRASFAASVGRRLGRTPLLVHRAPSMPAWPKLWMLLQRQALVSGAMPIWRGPTEPWPRAVPPAPLLAVALDADAVLAEEPEAIDIEVSLPPPDRDARRRLLIRLVPESAAWREADRGRIADRPGVTIGDLTRLGRQKPAGVEQAESRLRAACAERLGDLADRLETPFDWDDLILPIPLQEGLRDFAFEALHRTAYWERPEVRRLFGRGRGLVTLFAGPPGTGKTMAAQIIAREIGVDLFRIDLATLMSKYIGETAKNLKQVFTRAAGMHALILFDEADALFANRTEVKDSHDRYANTDTNYLLQQLEGFDGLAVLATNKKTNMDAAFLRRIRYVFDFPRPEAADRRRLWWTLTPPILGVEIDEALGRTLDRLGDRLEVSGAQIKTALVAGHFAACRRGVDRPTAQDVVKGIERELAKEGRTLTPRDRGRLAGDD